MTNKDTTKYLIVGKYIETNDDKEKVVGFQVRQNDGAEDKKYSVEEMAYLIGLGQVVNCQGFVNDRTGEFVFRGIGNLPIVGEDTTKVALRAKAAAGSITKLVYNDNDIRSIIAYQVKTPSGKLQIMKRDAVIKIAKEGLLANARVQMANGKVILRSADKQNKLTDLPRISATEAGLVTHTPVNSTSVREPKQADKVSNIDKTPNVDKTSNVNKTPKKNNIYTDQEKQLIRKFQSAVREFYSTDYKELCKEFPVLKTVKHEGKFISDNSPFICAQRLDFESTEKANEGGYYGGFIQLTLLSDRTGFIVECSVFHNDSEEDDNQEELSADMFNSVIQSTEDVKSKLRYAYRLLANYLK